MTPEPVSVQLFVDAITPQNPMRPPNDSRSRTLYEAGELGSMFSNLYQNGSYLTEAMISGRAAGHSAVMLGAWQAARAA